jgi:hypothetical protein
VDVRDLIFVTLIVAFFVVATTFFRACELILGGRPVDEATLLGPPPAADSTEPHASPRLARPGRLASEGGRVDDRPVRLDRPQIRAGQHLHAAAARLDPG